MIVVEECVFDRHEAAHAINLFDMNQKYADVLPLADVFDYLAKWRRRSCRKKYHRQGSHQCRRQYVDPVRQRLKGRTAGSPCCSCSNGEEMGGRISQLTRSMTPSDRTV